MPHSRQVGLGLLPLRSNSRAFFQTMRGLGSCELMIDGISGVAHNGTNATAVTDFSGKARSVALTTAPLASTTKWGGSLTALQFVRANVHRLNVGLVLAQPFTVITVFDQLTESGAVADSNLYRCDAGGAVGYLNAAINPDSWSMYAGNVFNSTFDSTNSPAKHIRTDCFNGASSYIAKGTSVQTGNAGTQGFQTAGLGLNIGCGIGGASPTSMILAFMGVWAKPLSAGELAVAVSQLAARYPGTT
jgi:hypothetical protein